MGDGVPDQGRRPEGRLIEPVLGYLTLPGTRISPSGYALHGAALLREIDRSMPVGWIVDLRENTGGASYPMLDVVAPLLSSGVRAPAPSVRRPPDSPPATSTSGLVTAPC